MKIKQTTLYTLLLTLSLLGCNTKKKHIAENFDYGTLENNTYTNHSLNFSIQFPTTWKVLEPAVTQSALAEASSEFSDKSAYKVSIEDINSMILIVAFLNEFSHVNFNSNINIMVENLKNYTAVKNPQEYLQLTRENLITKTKFEYSVIDERFPQITINGKKMYQMNLQSNANGTPLKQTMYCFFQKGLAVIITASYTNDDEYKKIEEALQTFDTNIQND